MKALDKLVSKAKKDKDILAVIVFGSYARGEKHRDIDVCLVLSKELENGVMSRKRLAYVSESGTGVYIFQQLPVYIKVRVQSKGKILFCRDLDALYDMASQTVREFEEFKHVYEMYYGSSYRENVKIGAFLSPRTSGISTGSGRR